MSSIRLQRLTLLLKVGVVDHFFVDMDFCLNI